MAYGDTVSSVCEFTGFYDPNVAVSDMGGFDLFLFCVVMFEESEVLGVF